MDDTAMKHRLLSGGKMKKKRFIKLCMGLRMSKRDAETLHSKRYGYGSNEDLINRVVFGFYNAYDFKHPAYTLKAYQVYSDWAKCKASTGDAIHKLGAYYDATKDLITIDKRKKVKA